MSQIEILISMQYLVHTFSSIMAAVTSVSCISCICCSNSSICSCSSCRTQQNSFEVAAILFFQSDASWRNIASVSPHCRSSTSALTHATFSLSACAISADDNADCNIAICCLLASASSFASRIAWFKAVVSELSWVCSEIRFSSRWAIVSLASRSCSRSFWIWTKSKSVNF